MKYSVWVGLVFTFVLYWTNIPITTYYCSPRIGEPWDAVAQTCSKTKIFLLIQGVFSVVLDVYILILPIPMVLKLQMSRKRRLSILGVFGTAVL